MGARPPARGSPNLRHQQGWARGGTAARARIWSLGEGDGGNSALAFQEPAASSPACKQRAGLKDKQTNRGEPIWGQPEQSDWWQGVLLLKCLFQ